MQSKSRQPFDSRKQRAIPVPNDYVPPKPVDSKPGNNDFFTINGTQFQRWSKKTSQPARVPSKTRSLDERIFGTSSRRPNQLHNSKKAMVECPHCLRIFQEGSAERHIKFCEEVHSRMPLYNENWEARSKLAIRTQYRPPLPRQRRLSNESRIISTPAKHHRRVAPVIEEGVASNLPNSMYTPRHQQLSTYNNRLDPNYENAVPLSRPTRSKMVTYGAVQPFSGPVISKENIESRKSRFADQSETKKAQRVYLTDPDGYQNESGLRDQVIMYPDTISAQIQTDQLETRAYSNQMPTGVMASQVPKLHPVYVHPVQNGMYPPNYWHPRWLHHNPWLSEDSYLQMAPKMVPPFMYHPQWSPYPVLPDVVPRYSGTFPRLRHNHSHALEYHSRDNPHQHCPLTDRSLLSRDETLLDDDHIGLTGSLKKHFHKHCRNCGSKFNNYGAHYCSDCGALNSSR